MPEFDTAEAKEMVYDPLSRAGALVAQVDSAAVVMDAEPFVTVAG